MRIRKFCNVDGERPAVDVAIDDHIPLNVKFLDCDDYVNRVVLRGEKSSHLTFYMQSGDGLLAEFTLLGFDHIHQPREFPQTNSADRINDSTLNSGLFFDDAEFGFACGHHGPQRKNCA